MYQLRHLADPLRHARHHAPVLFITGPRQSGKSTLVREECGGELPYVTFDDPLEVAFARDDPQGFLDRFPNGCILDEVQSIPSLFPYLKMRVDADRVMGRYLLTGSQQFALMEQIAESLAGRVAILELFPFEVAELRRPHRANTLEEIVWNGLYPEPALYPERRDLWMSSYIRTYVERDVRRMRKITDLAAFEQLVMLAAAAHGQELNIARLSRQIGLTQPTVKAWLGILEAAYVGVRIPPYFRNLGKRVVKSPKWFFIDSGLVCELTRQPSGAAAVAGAMGGALFEGLIVAEAIKTLAHAGRRRALYHWRSHDQSEVDLIIGTRDRLVPVEIKATATPLPRHTAMLTRFAELEPDAAPGLLVCRVPAARPMPGGHTALPWDQFGSWLAERIL